MWACLIVLGTRLWYWFCQIKRKKTSEESDVEVDDKVKNGIKQFHPSGLIGFLLNLIFFEVGGKYDKLFGFEILQIHQ